MQKQRYLTNFDALKVLREQQPAQILKWLHSLANSFVCGAASATSAVMCITDASVHFETVPPPLGCGNPKQGVCFLPQSFSTKHTVVHASEPICGSIASIARNVEQHIATNDKIQVVFVDWKLFSGGAKGLTMMLNTIMGDFNAVLKSEAVFVVFFTQAYLICYHHSIRCFSPLASE